MKVDVITYLSGYQSFIYERFLGTLYDTGFSGNVHIVCKNSDIEIINKLKEKYEKITIHLDKRIKPKWPHIRRFYSFKNIIQNLNCDYVLVCDGRDVLFQKNIEEFDFQYDLYLAEEEITHSQCKWNTMWLHFLEKQFKENFYENIKNKKVICSGTTIGKLEVMKVYINLMLTIIDNYNWGDYKGEQGIHNYLYYKNIIPSKIKNINLSNCNKTTPFNTVGAPLSLNLHHLSKFKIIDDKICDLEENISYIVHQWDRLNEDDRKKLSVKYNFNNTNNL